MVRPRTLCTLRAVPTIAGSAGLIGAAQAAELMQPLSRQAVATVRAERHAACAADNRNHPGHDPGRLQHHRQPAEAVRLAVNHRRAGEQVIEDPVIDPPPDAQGVRADQQPHTDELSNRQEWRCFRAERQLPDTGMRQLPRDELQGGSRQRPPEAQTLGGWRRSLCRRNISILAQHCRKVSFKVLRPYFLLVFSPLKLFRAICVSGCCLPRLCSCIVSARWRRARVDC